MPLELVIFDMAGTTFQDRDGVSNSFREALAAAGLTVDPTTVKGVMGLPKPEALRRLITASPQAASFLPRLPAIHADFVKRMQQYYVTNPAILETPGAGALFAQLRRNGIKVALNSGFSRDIAQIILTRLGWLEGQAIDASVTSDEVPRGRPHPDMVLHLMKRLGITDPRNVAKVGDTPADLQEGTNAGCGLVIGVTQGSHTREQLAQYPHSHLISTVADLPGLLATLGVL